VSARPDRRRTPAFQLAHAPTKRKLGTENYADALAEAEARLRTLQLSYMRHEERAVIVFEGWDASGKGGTIRRMAGVLEPRAVDFWSIGAPRERWHGRHYLERFWSRLPEPGHLAVFDRSWYGRVLVERVEGLADESAWRRAYGEITAFEDMLAADGVRIVKIFMHLSSGEQLARFRKRLSDPAKRWKLSTEDVRNRGKRDAYEAAITDMVRETSTHEAPWHVIPADSKKYGRVAAMRTIHDTLAAGLDIGLPDVDPEAAAMARDELGLSLPEEDA
jgi:polyphosphate kinase 2 (PPK2 family)